MIKFLIRSIEKYNKDKKLEKYLTVIERKKRYKIKENNQIINLRRGTSDLGILRDIFGEGDYELNNINSKEIKTIIDCGANIGIASLFFNMKYPDAKIFSLEPEFGNYNQLLKNISGISNIIPIKKGLWSKKTFLKVEDIGLDKCGFIVKEVSKEETEIIEAISIKELMKENNIEFIDILKIDIEGSEKEVFESSEEWLDKVGILIIEVHDRMKKGCGMTLFKAISKYNFLFELQGENLIFYLKNNF